MPRPKKAKAPIEVAAIDYPDALLRQIFEEDLGGPEDTCAKRILEIVGQAVNPAIGTDAQLNGIAHIRLILDKYRLYWHAGEEPFSTSEQQRENIRRRKNDLTAILKAGTEGGS